MTKYDWKRISFDDEASHFFLGRLRPQPTWAN